MKRKVVQHGPSTLIVSLPSKWVQEYGVKKGAELDMDQEGNRLIISTSSRQTEEKATVNFNEYATGTNALIYRYLSALYKVGFDEMHITYSSHSDYEVAQRTINNEFIGFEVVEEKRNYMVARRVSSLESEQFDTILKRTFLFIVNTASEGHDELKADNKVELKNLILRDIHINKFTNYCRRLINKSRVVHIKRTHTLYALIEQLEKISDGYKKVFGYVGNLGPIKLSTGTMKIYETTNKFFKEYYTLYYNFKIDKLDEFLSNKEKAHQDILDHLQKCPPKERPLLLYLFNIQQMIFDCNGVMMATHL